MVSGILLIAISINAYLQTLIKCHKSYEKIINIVKNLDIPIIDIYKELHLTLEDHTALYPFGLLEVHHYNELGYRLIAETILKKIDEYD